MGKTALVIFIRNPELGKVKTRLAKSVGDQKALEIYQQLVEHTRIIASKTQVDRFVFYSNTIEENDNWSTNLFHKQVQKSGDLGSRMTSAFNFIFNLGYQKAIIIGSDCIEMSTEIIEEANSILDSHDIVIGPALDGGYYLLGMKQLYQNLFENMVWSVDTVYKETIKRIKKLDLSYQTVETLNDIDDIEDWKKYNEKSG